MQSLPEETVAHVQSAGCKAQKKSVTGAHNKCWKYLLCAITMAMAKLIVPSFSAFCHPTRLPLRKVPPSLMCMDIQKSATT